MSGLDALKHKTHQAMREDAVIAARIHNIIHATGHGVQLAPADTERYNNLANMDALMTYGEPLDVQGSEQNNVLGLHTDLSTILTHASYAGDPEKAVYFDGTSLEKENDTEVALRTSAFDMMQQSQAFTHYGRSNAYDMRGFQGIREAQEAQRQQYVESDQPLEMANRINPDIVNDTRSEFNGVRPASALCRVVL